MLEQSPVSLSTILEKSHWDSSSITAVWCESQVMFRKAVLPFKKSSTPPQSPPNSDFRFQISYFVLQFQKVNKTNTVHYKSKRKQYQKLHKLSKVKGAQWPKELRLLSWSLPCTTYWHRHLSNSHITLPSLCKSSIQCWSIKEIAISEFARAPVSKQG